jgi:hypothetical protein
MNYIEYIVPDGVGLYIHHSNNCKNTKKRENSQVYNKNDCKKIKSFKSNEFELNKLKDRIYF